MRSSGIGAGAGAVNGSLLGGDPPARSLAVEPVGLGSPHAAAVCECWVPSILCALFSSL